MSFYSLTEAYSEIYDPRKVEKIDDNFRFIDYMLDEDIEEVVESLVWEFRDYGYTLDESFDLLTYAASTEVITESYEMIIEELLNEANVTFGRGDIAGNIAKRKAAMDAKATEQRREPRRSRVDGVISKVKSAMAGAKGGMGRASKALGGAVKKGMDIAGGAAQKGKALLGRLLRKGASMAGQAVKSGTRQTGRALSATGRSISASGNKAAAAPATTRSAKVGRTTYTSTTEPGGSKRQAVGRAVRKVGAALQRSTSQTPRMTRADYDANKAKRTAAAQAANADAFANPSNTKISYKIGSRMKTSRYSPGIKPAANGNYSVGTKTPRYADGSPAGPSGTWRKYGQDSDSPKNAPSRFKSPRASTGISRASIPDKPTPKNTTPIQKPQKTSFGRIRQTDSEVANPNRTTRTRGATSAPSSTRSYPTEPSGQTTMFTGRGPKGRSTGAKVEVPTGGRRQIGKTRKPKPTERTRQTSLLNKLNENNQLEQILQYIAEDLIEAGYSVSIDESYDLIETLDENTLNEIIFEYIEE